jgi:hypothetical protein
VEQVVEISVLFAAGMHPCMFLQIVQSSRKQVGGFGVILEVYVFACSHLHNTIKVSSLWCLCLKLKWSTVCMCVCN